MKTRTNLRRATRRAVRVPCQVVRERGFRLVGDASADLSTEGMRVSNPQTDVAVGESVIVSFQGTETGVWFDLDARVARIIGGRRKGDHGHAVGIAFENQSALGRLMLRGALAKMPLTVPARKPALIEAVTDIHVSVIPSGGARP